jgi:signal transduction histidine kinase
MVQSVNLQVNAMLQSAYIQEMYLWEEVVRRFLSKNSEDNEVIEFQKQCKKDRIPDFLMVPENWQIDPERVLGGGDQFLAKQEADSLLSQSQRFDPNSQRQILRKWVATTTRNPDMADNLVPNDPVQADAGTFAAEDVFGTLMQGIPTSIREGIERTSYIQALLGMFGSKVQQIMQTGGVGTAENIIGLQTVGQHIEQNIAILEQDATQGEFVKVASDELGKLMNEVKGFQQRLQQQMEADATEQDPEAMAKVQTQTMLAENKMQISQATTAQKMEQKQMAFEQKMRQDMEKHALDMQRMMADMDVDIITKGARTKADIEATKAKAAAAPASNGEKN